MINECVNTKRRKVLKIYLKPKKSKVEISVKRKRRESLKKIFSFRNS